MKHIYIINPAAGRGDSSERLKKDIAAAYADADEAPEVYLTTGVGDATRYVHAWCVEHPQEQARFYACGGDGTLGEVVSGAMGHPHVAVGLIPVGTGNDFVRGFNACERFMNVDAQRAGQEMKIDVMRCNGKYAVNLINAGFDCEVVVKTGEIKRRPWVPAGMAYGMGVAIELVRKPGVKVELSVDGGEFVARELLLCAVGNGAFYGGGFKPLPFASLTDGMLDLCMVDNVSRTKFVRLVGTYKRGEHVVPANKDFLHYQRCRSLAMRFAEPQNLCMDGEVVQVTECTVEVLPCALRLVVPRGCTPVVMPDYHGEPGASEPVLEEIAR